jgi:enoyl-CoA hydratase/carnithine racemase
MAKELRHLVEIAETPDFAEGLSAFFEKREPRFHGA